jgi:acyl transferase domain-containing protein
MSPLRYPDETVVRKMAQQYQEQMFKEQQQALEASMRADKERHFRETMAVLVNRVTQLESQISYLTCRLSKAEAAARRARVREGKFLESMFTQINELADNTKTLKRLQRLWREITDGKSYEEQDQYMWQDTDLHN